MKRYNEINKKEKLNIGCGRIVKLAIAGLLAASFLIVFGSDSVKANEVEEADGCCTVESEKKEEKVPSYLPIHPDSNTRISDIKKYYAVSQDETSIYDLKPGSVYVMYESPTWIPFSGGYKLIRVEKRWERERGGIFRLFDATITTIQYYDYAENEHVMNMPIGGGFCRFYSLNRITNVYDPSLENQMDII